MFSVSICSLPSSLFLFLSNHLLIFWSSWLWLKCTLCTFWHFNHIWWALFLAYNTRLLTEVFPPQCLISVSFYSIFSLLFLPIKWYDRDIECMFSQENSIGIPDCGSNNAEEKSKERKSFLPSSTQWLRGFRCTSLTTSLLSLKGHRIVSLLLDQLLPNTPCCCLQHRP